MSNETAPETTAIQSDVAQIKKLMSFIGGKFLDSTAVPVEGIELTITGLRKAEVENPRTHKPEDKWVLYFDELPEFGMVLGAKCNRKAAMARLGDSSREWAGKKLRIYRDPEVKFGKNKVGGIRIY